MPDGDNPHVRRISKDLAAYDPSDTFGKISNYFESVCRAMVHQREGQKGLFNNSADVGYVVEDKYRAFLAQHVPSACDILQGGYVFDVGGRRSHQMDVIVHSANTHRFRDDSGKACATLEGAIADVEVTSFLDGRKIDDELEKFAFIPPTKEFRGLGNRDVLKQKPDFQNFWLDTPLKVVVAFDGVSASAALDRINSFYAVNDHIPVARRVNVLHMLNRYCIIKSDFDVYPDSDPSQRDVYTAVATGRVDTLATSLILTRITQLLHLVSRNAYTANDLRRNMMRHLK